MADLINLRHARKQKSRDDQAKRADANRAKFGQTKAEKQLTKLQAALDTKNLDGHQRKT